MARITLIDAQAAGISGDMLLAALIDAGAEVSSIQQVLHLIPRHFSRCKSINLTTSEVKSHGFRARRAKLTIAEDADETKAEELLRATQETAIAANLSGRAKLFANNAVQLLIEVESKLHGVELSSAHLHEAGSADTLADILGTAAACESLGVFEGEIYASPVAVGGGRMTFSHGTVSVPAPAVLEIARRHRIPIIGGPVNQELATPTGISMLASLADSFVQAPPPLIPDKVGYGAGEKELANLPNMLRLIIGQTSGQHRFDRDSVQVMETNLDDVSGEIVGNSIQRILDAGAKDVWVTSGQFKKNRPGYTLHAICSTEDLEKIAQVIVRETGTLGVRYQRWDRFVLAREILLVKLRVEDRTFDVRVKIARDGSGQIVQMKPEFEDVDSIAQATSRTSREIATLAIEAAKNLMIDRHSS